MSRLNNLVEELLSLNDENLIERVTNTNDVQGCLEELYAILTDEQCGKKSDPLTLDELREMGGDPAWCKEYQCWGIVKYETIGSWANKPFFVGAWHDRGVAVDFEYDIEARGLTLYRHKPEVDR